MIRQNNYTKITLTGLNIERYINILRDNDIEIYGIHRDNASSMSMYVKDIDIRYIRDNCGKIDIEIKEGYGIKQTIKFLLNRIGIVIGVVLSILMILISNMYTLHIKVLGIESIEEREVIQALNEYGIYIGKVNKYDRDDLHKYLVKAIPNISLVSSEKIGTALIINIKEKDSIIEGGVTPYISPYNMVINDYDIYSGISNIEIDGVVKKGDIIVYPEEYIDSDGVLHLKSIKGKLSVILWHNATYTLFKEETIFVRTGNATTSIEYMLGKNVVYSSIQDNPYRYYEVEDVTQNISNSLIPLSIHKTTIYETTKEIKTNDFIKEKEKIIAKLQGMVYNELRSSESVQNEIVDIKELDDRYIINLYLECTTDIYIGE